MHIQDANGSVVLLRAKRPYHSPLLMAYGNLVDLTATGSGSASESNSGSNSDMPCIPQWKLHNSCG